MLSRTTTLVLITILLISSCAFSQSFKIEDFIPVKFVDKQLRLRGELGFSDNYRESIINQSYNVFDRNKGENNESDFRFNLNADYHFQKETIPSFIDFSISVRPGIKISDNDDSNFQTDLDDHLAYYNEIKEQDISQYEIQLQPRLTAGKYLHNDFFASVYADIAYRYLGTPKRDLSLVTESSQLAMIDYTNERYHYFQNNNLDNHDVGEDSRNYFINLEFLPGYGRVYEGNYAVTAIYIIDELRKNNLLIREPTNEEMIQLSELVYQKRNEYYLDYRIHRIETFDRLLVYLKETNLTELSGNLGHLLVADVWDYFPRSRRRFGLKFSFGPGIEYHLTSSQHTNDQKISLESKNKIYDFDGNLISESPNIPYSSNYHYYSHQKLETKDIYLTAKVEYYKPISFKWHFESNLTYRHSLDSYMIQSSYNETNEYTEIGSSSYFSSMNYYTKFSNKKRINLNSNLIYFYDSRTNLSFSGSITYQKYDERRITNSGSFIGITKSKFSDWAGHLGANLNYRISIPTTLNVRLNYDLTDYSWGDLDNYPSNYNRRFSISTSLTHYLF